MSSTDLIFRVLGLNEASKVFEEVSASARETAAVVEESNAEQRVSFEKTAATQEESAEAGAESKDLMGVSPGLLGVAAAAALVGAKSVEMAQNFEKGITTLSTGAGESQKNLKMVADGELQLATATGTTTDQLTQGMFMIESAGFHGAQGLTVLRAAAEGAKVGNADLSTVSNALTDVLNDYHLKAGDAVKVTDMLVTTVGSGKTNMEELAGSLSAVVPLAASAHIGFDQVAGALATMTAHGVSAQQSSQDLANTIRSLQAPNAVAVKEMQSLGLNSNEVSQQLGSKGLTGTLTELTSAITSHMGPAGLVIQSAFNASTQAAANAKTMMGEMPPQLRSLAQEMLNGSITTKQWSTDLKGMSPVNANLLTQFAGVAKQTHEFNNTLTGGGPAAQTYNAALEKMTGGATGLATSLLLTGENSAQFAGNVKAVGDAGKSTGKDVQGWSQVTDTLSFKMDQAKEVIETTGIKLGEILLPAVKLAVSAFTGVAEAVSTGVGWLEHHKTVAEALGIGIAAVLLPSLWGMVTALGAAAATAIAAAAPFAGVILIVSGLAFGILELVKHWGTVEHVFVEGFDFVKAHWKEFVAALLPGVGILIVGVTELVEHWTQVQHFLGDLWHDTAHFFDVVFVEPVEDSVKALGRWVVDGFEFFDTLFTHDIPGWWDDAVHFFDQLFVTPIEATVTDLGRKITSGVQFFEQIFTRDIPSWFETGIHFFESIFVTPIEYAVSRISSAFSSGFGAIKGFVATAFSDLVGIVKAPINAVIGIVDNAIGALDSLHVSIPSWVPVVGGQSWGVDIPQIPMLAAGGLVMPRPGGTTVTVAEAGQPEIVTPLPAMQQAVAQALAAAGASHSGSTADTFYARLDLTLNAQHFDRVLVKFQREGGRLQFLQTAGF